MDRRELTRRHFLHLAGLGAAGTLFSHGAPQALAEGPKPAAEYDVIVCGGGTSGLPAAIAAARQGARVAIIERYGFLGGNAAFSIMPAWHGLREHHSGLLTRFAQRVEAFGVGPAPLRDGIRPNELSINTTRVYELDGTNADDLTKAEIATRKQAWAVWRFLKENVPGFENSVLTETAVQVGVRESRCIKGDYVLTAEEGLAGKRFADSVQTCRVKWDSHDTRKYETGGQGNLVDVPYGCFLPKGLEGVVIVGRTASCDHLMNSGFRRMENAFQSGEVGGTAVGLAVKVGVTPRRLAVKRLQTELRQNGFKTAQDGLSGAA